MKKLINFKNILFIFILFLPAFLFSSANLNLGNNTKQYNKIFERISETRIGVAAKTINKIKNPFVVIYKKAGDTNKTKKAKIIYNLDAIFNKKAMINGKWYKKRAKIGAYRLIKIKKRSVLLRSQNTKKELFIRKDNESKIKFSSK
ncbi:MAG: hypothetical protein QM482_06600 [Sulfurospirillum sp.]